jgi:hypothetical protein
MIKTTDIVQDLICHRLGIHDFKFVEIESKKRVIPEDAKELRKYLIKRKKVDHVKTSFFFDQFLDTPQFDLLKLGASMRLRYKRNGSMVYLQYKGPGFIDQGLLYRSEFSSKPLKHVFLEESHHDIIRFTKTSVRNILTKHLHWPMKAAMVRHLGRSVIDRISVAPIIGVYQKDKFTVDLGNAFLEPSLDRIFAFHISKDGLHPLSTFSEYENEIKSKTQSLDSKIKHIPDLLEFDLKIAKRFRMKPERLDKYHRCASIFLPRGSRPLERRRST